MAVTIDAVANGGVPSSRSNFNYSHTIAVGCKKILIYVSGMSDGREVSALTVGGQSATLLLRITQNTGAHGGFLELWEKTNPLTGAQAIDVTLNAAIESTAFSVSFLGASGNHGTPQQANSTNLPAISSAVGDLVSDGVTTDIGGTCAAATLTPGGSQTECTGLPLCTDTNFKLSGSTQAGAASVSMTWTSPATDLRLGVNIEAEGGAPLNLGAGSVPFSSTPGRLDIRASNQILIGPA